MMKATYVIDDPDSVSATVTITMSVENWDTLRSQLEHKWPSSDLSRAINDLLRRARKEIYYPDGTAF